MVFQAAAAVAAVAPLVERVQPLDTVVPVEDRLYLIFCVSIGPFHEFLKIFF
jgi:hypothetical protein